MDAFIGVPGQSWSQGRGRKKVQVTINQFDKKQAGGSGDLSPQGPRAEPGTFARQMRAWRYFFLVVFFAGFFVVAFFLAAIALSPPFLFHQSMFAENLRQQNFT